MIGVKTDVECIVDIMVPNDMGSRPLYEPLLMDFHFDNVCPICGQGFSMGSDSGCIRAFNNMSSLEDESCEAVCVHRCPVCNGLFVTKHEVCCDDTSDFPMDISHQVFPKPKMVFDTYIEGLKEFSPRFYTLYASAVDARLQGMFAIVGNVFRIALECIVKDYAKHLCPGDVDRIDRLKLADCISCYLKDVPLEKDLADAVRTIGNGFTHYICEFSKKDVDAMEAFLNLFCMHVYYKLASESQVEVARDYLKKRV